MSVDKDVGVPPDDARNIAVFLENSNLVGDGTGSEFGHSETQVEDCGEGEGRKEVRERGDDETDEGRVGWGKMSMLDEVGVHDGIKKVVIDRVVDMRILIVVNPVLKIILSKNERRPC